MVQQSSQGGRGGEREFTRHPGGGGGYGICLCVTRPRLNRTLGVSSEVEGLCMYEFWCRGLVRNGCSCQRWQLQQWSSAAASVASDSVLRWHPVFGCVALCL
jgi:hypothetical protein